MLSIERKGEIAYAIVRAETLSGMKNGFNVSEIHNVASKIQEPEGIVFGFFAEIYRDFLISTGNNDANIMIPEAIQISRDERLRISYKMMRYNFVIGRSKNIKFALDEKKEAEIEFKKMKVTGCSFDEVYELIKEFEMEKMKIVMNKGLELLKKARNNEKKTGLVGRFFKKIRLWKGNCAL